MYAMFIWRCRIIETLGLSTTYDNLQKLCFGAVTSGSAYASNVIKVTYMAVKVNVL